MVVWQIQGASAIGGLVRVQRFRAGERGVSGGTFGSNFCRGIFGILRFDLNDTPRFLGLAEFYAGVWRLELQIPLGYARGILRFALNDSVCGSGVSVLPTSNNFEKSKPLHLDLESANRVDWL
ncbi:MAG: hypothetical protein ACP5M4_12595 [Acidobacteriaceae bacterium]